jgi:hypothetical protein
MTYEQIVVWSMIRSMLVAAVSVVPAVILNRFLAGISSPLRRNLGLTATIAPFLVPELLTGFEWRSTATRISSQAGPETARAVTEAIYFALQVFRCGAVGTFLLQFFPESQVSRESVHAWRLLRTRMALLSWWLTWVRLQLAGPGRSLALLWSLTSLVAFQEFEIAALMQIDQSPMAWTVTLFDSHALRQPLSDSLRMLIGPILCELILMTPGAFMLLGARGKTDSGEPHCGTAHPGSRVGTPHILFARVYLAIGLLVFIAWPVLKDAEALVTGAISLLSDGIRLQASLTNVLGTTLFAAASALIAMQIAIVLLSALRLPDAGQSGTAAVRFFVVSAFIIPGLTGSLTLSMGLLAFFQLPRFNMLYDTWLPLLLGQTFAVLPRALAIVLLLEQFTDSSGAYCARLLSASPDQKLRARGADILWRLTSARSFVGLLVVGQWCFWDVTVASILRPVQVEPVVTRLYNEMHYGRTEALLSQASLAVFTPFAIWVSCLLGHRWFTLRRAAPST